MKNGATPRENLLRTLKRQGFEQVPIDPNFFCQSQIEAFNQRFGHDDYMAFFNAPHRCVHFQMEKTWADPKQLFPREDIPENTDIDAYGVGHSHHPGCFHMTRMHHPLSGEPSMEEVASHPMPRLQPNSLAMMTAAVDGIHAKGLAAMAHMQCTVWETAWYIRSMEDLMADMMSDDERATLHFDRVTDFAVERATLAARAGVDILPTCMELAGLPVPDGVDGESLLPACRGECRRRAYVHIEHANLGSPAFHCLTDGKQKFIWFPEDGREQFFNLQDDPARPANSPPPRNGAPPPPGGGSAWSANSAPDPRASSRTTPSSPAAPTPMPCRMRWWMEESIINDQHSTSNDQ